MIVLTHAANIKRVDQIIYGKNAMVFLSEVFQCIERPSTKPYKGDVHKMVLSLLSHLIEWLGIQFTSVQM